MLERDGVRKMANQMFCKWKKILMILSDFEKR